MKPDRRTWRVRGVPPGYSRHDLETVLRHHPSLQCYAADTQYISNPHPIDNGSTILTLAVDLKPCFQVATVRFGQVPPQLDTLTGQLTIDIPRNVMSDAHVTTGTQAGGAKRSKDTDTIETAKLTIDSVFDGLTVLHCPPPDHHNLDILAVSGLGSHPFGSFVSKEDGNMWLSQSVPQDLASARVIIYGYNTTMVASTSFANLGALASFLHSALVQLLASSQSIPLILVTHSLGGLLAKEAITRISNSGAAPQVMRRVIAILFFGVPHDGMDIESLIPMVQREPNAALLMSIDRIQSEVLQLQKQNFDRVMQASPHIEVYCLYETSMSPTAIMGPDRKYTMSGPLRCLVTIPSATSCLPGGSSSDAAFAIPRTHSDLVKFLYHDANYDLVRYILEGIAQRHASNVLEPPATIFGPEFLENDTRERLLQSLRFDQARSREMTIDAAHGQTCCWLLQNPQYKDWLDECKLKDHHGFLWIKGHPGTGKSTLMKYALSVSRSNHGGATLVIAHFFNARGADLEHSTIGLYRSLLVQLFEGQPGLLSSFDAFLRERAIEVTDALHLLPSNLSLLKALLSMLITKQKRSLVCFIDALDECATYEARDMILFLRGLGEMAVESSVEFRVCLASRHYPYIDIDRSLELVLDDQHGHVEDIATYIRSVFVIRGDGHASNLRKKILTKSQGIFMWAVLVVHILNEEYDGDIIRLDRRLNDIPVGLHELFRGIISRDKQNYDKFVFCIQVILFAYRPIRPIELYSAVQAGTGECKPRPTKGDDPALDLPVFVLSTCKGLALITKEDSTVQFIHESVRDFLLKGNGYQELWPGSLKDFEAHSHNQLSACCRRYITVARRDAIAIFIKSGGHKAFSVMEINGLRQRFATAVVFLEYSVTNILRHANAAEGGGISQRQPFVDFPWHDYGLFRHVFLYHKSYPRSRLGDSRAQIYARDNLQHLILGCSPDISFTCGSRGNPPAVLIAFTEGNLDAFRAICQIYRRHTNQKMEHMTMPDLSMSQFDKRSHPGWIHRLDFGSIFSCLAALADDKICLTVLKSGIISFEEQISDKNGRSVLSLAAEFGKEEVVRTIIDHLTPFWQLKLPTLFTLRHWIQRKINDEYALLSTSIKIDDKSRREGITALGYACKNGHASIVKRLLGTGLVDPNSRDIMMRTPLHYCVSCSNLLSLAIVQLLLRNAKIEPDLRDSDGRTPLSLALAEGGSMPIATVLLETGKVDLEAKDVNGLSPLDYFGRENIATSSIIQSYIG